MTNARYFTFFVLMLLLCSAKPTYREMAQPTVDTFCRLYSVSHYDSIIAMLRTGATGAAATSATPRLRLMLQLFREKLGAVKGGRIGDVTFVRVSETDSVAQVTFDADFESGPGYIRFDFMPDKKGLALE